MVLDLLTAALFCVISVSEGGFNMFRTSCRAAARRSTIALTACLALAIAAPALAKAEKTRPTLRVMLNPSTAPRGTLPDNARVRLESLVGAKVTVAAITRTGALDLVIGDSHDKAALQALAGRLRTERSVLWAEVAEAQTVRPKAAIAAKAAQEAGRKLLVRFDDGADPRTAVSRLSALWVPDGKGANGAAMCSLI